MLEVYQMFYIICFTGFSFAVRWACSLWTPKLVSGDLHKFHDALHKSIVRVWLTYYSISLGLSKEYFWDPTLLWAYEDGQIRENCTRRITPDEHVLYISMFGYYLQQMLSMFHEPKRADFWAIFTHHVLTTILLIGAHSSGWAAGAGVIVAFCHELPDHILVLAKCCVYLGIQYLADAFFALLVISWLYLRIYLLPLKIFIPGLTFWKVGIISLLPFPVLKEKHCSLFYFDLLCYSLILMYGLDIYWCALLLKALGKKLKTGEVKDVRSDDEKESEDCDKSIPSNSTSSHFRQVVRRRNRNVI